MDDAFEANRGLLFSVAYRMLGSVADAEDIVQDTWLRWASADRSHVEDAKAYLVRIAGNLAVDRLRSAQVKRESYVGPWLPEPVLTSPDVADDVARAESVSVAMLIVLETLSPLERAVFVLREVFGFPFSEIAEVLDRSAPTVRQLAHRAREHVQARRPRITTAREERKAAVERFFAAARGGDINELMAVLAPDVTLWTDGGGKVRAALRPLQGAEKVAAWLVGIQRRPWQGTLVTELVIEPAELNGGPGLIAYADGVPVSALTAEIDGDGRVTAIHAQANPDKLQSLTEERRLTE